jgi:osmotically-inducible protein OsmY
MRPSDDYKNMSHSRYAKKMRQIVNANINPVTPQFDRRQSESYNENSRHDTHERGWLDRAGDEVLSWFGDDYAERRRRHDGPHRGKGPKGYQRADERIKEDISDRLTEEWNVDASDLTVTVENGDVILSGFVKDRFQKRRAADIAEEVSGVKNVENRIRIEPTTEML